MDFYQIFGYKMEMSQNEINMWKYDLPKFQQQFQRFHPNLVTMIFVKNNCDYGNTLQDLVGLKEYSSNSILPMRPSHPYYCGSSRARRGNATISGRLTKNRYDWKNKQRKPEEKNHKQLQRKEKKAEEMEDDKNIYYIPTKQRKPEEKKAEEMEDDENINHIPTKQRKPEEKNHKQLERKEKKNEEMEDDKNIYFSTDDDDEQEKMENKLLL